MDIKILVPGGRVQTDIGGRVRNLELAATTALQPMFEAVVNSFQAIEERDAGSPKGRIDVSVARRPDLEDSQLALDRESQGEILGFDITDNGVGFTDENFAAFETADTTRKIAKGGKGVGRFLWLKAFYDVDVNSI